MKTTMTPAEAFTIKTPHGVRTVYHVAPPRPIPQRSSLLAVRLVMAHEAWAILVPRAAPLTKGGRVLDTVETPETVLSHGRLVEVTPQPVHGIGYDNPEWWGDLVFDNGVSVPYAAILPERLTAEEVTLVKLHKAATIRTAQIKKAVESAIEPLTETFKKATRRAAPPHTLEWWQNLQRRYEDAPGPMEKDKWLAVAHAVVAGAIEEGKKLRAAERRSDYLTPRMLRNLIRELNASGASRAKIEGDLAENLRSRVQKEARRHKTASA